MGVELEKGKIIMFKTKQLHLLKLKINSAHAQHLIIQKRDLFKACRTFDVNNDAFRLLGFF